MNSELETGVISIFNSLIISWVMEVTSLVSGYGLKDLGRKTTFGHSPVVQRMYTHTQMGKR